MKVSKWMNKVKATAARNGYVTTLSGRRRLISNIASVNSNERAQAERQGISPLLADIFFTFSPIKF
jgi:DNA polymerase I-like protein with 3'-5' exonuclease and polymerase domains